MIYNVSHRTTYRYAYTVSFGNHVACLKPRTFAGSRLTRNDLQVRPLPTTLTERTDYFGNHLFYFTVEEPHKELVVEARSEVVVACGESLEPHPSPAWEEAIALPDAGSDEATIAASQFQFESPRIRMRPEYAQYAMLSFTPGRPMREALLDLTSRIHRDFRFDSKVTTVRTPVDEVFAKRQGVCQDFAHLQIACLRSLGVAARYVSGYLRTFPPPGRLRLVGADASHAWISAYCPGLGWMDMDPTNNVAPTDGHVTLAWGRDYSDVSPLRGLILGGGHSTLKVEVDMEPIEGDKT